MCIIIHTLARFVTVFIFNDLFLVYTSIRIIAHSKYSLKLSCFVCKREHVCVWVRSYISCGFASHFNSVVWMKIHSLKWSWLLHHSNLRVATHCEERSSFGATARSCELRTATRNPEMAHNLFHGWRGMANECVVACKSSHCFHFNACWYRVQETAQTQAHLVAKNVLFNYFCLAVDKADDGNNGSMATIRSYTKANTNH